MDNTIVLHHSKTVQSNFQVQRNINNDSGNRKRFVKRKKTNNGQKKQKTNANVNPIYVHSFDQEESVKRGKAWDTIEVKNKISHSPIQNCTNPAVESALYNECDLSVACLIHGIFADAQAKIEELLQDGEEAPKFNATLGTEDAIKDASGDLVDMEYPSKKRFAWYHKVPV